MPTRPDARRRPPLARASALQTAVSGVLIGRTDCLARSSHAGNRPLRFRTALWRPSSSRTRSSKCSAPTPRSRRLSEPCGTPANRASSVCERPTLRLSMRIGNGVFSGTIDQPAQRFSLRQKTCFILVADRTPEAPIQSTIEILAYAASERPSVRLTRVGLCKQSHQSGTGKRHSRKKDDACAVADKATQPCNGHQSRCARRLDAEV